MADFVEMPVQGGVGPYHFNRYRIVFDAPVVSKEGLARNLIMNFPSYLNSQYATVEKTKRTFNSKPTLKFHGIKNMPVVGDVARPHHDWVVVDPVDWQRGFTARTLRREFIDVQDDGVAGGLAGAAGGLLGAAEAVRVNQRHFLAGRRCWRLDTAEAFHLPDVPGQKLVLETTAVERFSCPEYVLADAAFGMEKLVPNIWCSMLWNFVRQNSLTADPLKLKSGWIYGKVGFNNVQYYSRQLPDLSALLHEPEFLDAYCYFPTVIDLSAPPNTA